MKIRSRYKTYSREEVKAAFDSDTPFEHVAWYATKMMLEERLDAIWRKWNEQCDYGFEMNEKKKVVRSWGIVETMLEHWGLETFEKVFYSTKFGQTGYGIPLPEYFINCGE